MKSSTPVSTGHSTDSDIIYELTRSNRIRGASIRVLPDNRVVVHAGKRVSRQWIDQVVNRRKKWIEQSISRNESYRLHYRPDGITDGAVFPYLGIDRVLNIENNISCAPETKDNHISLFFRKKSPTEREIRKKLADWYRSEAREYFAEKVAEFGSIVGKAPNAIRVKGQGSRWGSCSSKGNLNLNWKLMLAPPEVINYVVAHEVCHLVHANHSPRFWGLVHEIYPSTDSAKKWLLKEGSRLMWIAWPLTFLD